MTKGRQIEMEVTEEKVTKKVKEQVKEAPKMGKDDFFEAVTGISIPKEPAKTKKNGIPTLSDVPDEVKQAVDEVVAAKKAMKEAKAVLETKEQVIIDHVMPIYEEDGFGNNVHKSYYVPGTKEQITFVTSDKFSAPKDDEIPELQEVLGDKFEEFIKKDTEVMLRPEIFTNKILQQKLMDAVKASGANFGDFFAAQTKWYVSEGFDVKRFSLPKKIYEKVMGILRQAKPSLK